MKTWCIEFKRDIGVQCFIPVKQMEKPNKKEAIEIVHDSGYNFESGGEVTLKIYEV